MRGEGRGGMQHRARREDIQILSEDDKSRKLRIRDLAKVKNEWVVKRALNSWPWLSV